MFCTEAGEVVPRGTWCWTHWDMGVLWHFFISFLAWVWSCRVGAVLFWERITEWSWEEQQPLTLGHGLPWPDCIRAGCGWRRAMQAAQLCMWIWLWHIVREPQQDSWGFPLPVFTSPWILAVSEGDEISGIEGQPLLYFSCFPQCLFPLVINCDEENTIQNTWQQVHAMSPDFLPYFLRDALCAFFKGSFIE